jgi:hypothetical protein
MNEITSLSFALDPKNIPSFLLDWEVTKLCNLDCSYCTTGIEYGGHDNSTKHPPLEECIKSIDFMFAYVDLYMKYKKLSQRKVILNVYGGESLYHPNIVEILNEVHKKYQAYKDNWFLTVTCTTNAIIGAQQWKKITPLIDNFTLSYHSEVNQKQKEIFKKNALNLKNINKPHKVIVMMNNKKELWQDSITMVEFCKQNNINFVAKPLDNGAEEWSYSPEQFNILKTFWINQVSAKQQDSYKEIICDVGTTNNNSINQGRACCGGRQLSMNSDLKNKVTFVPKQNFKSWYCSVNWFFLFVQQLTGNVYVNKDCRMNFNGDVGAIGNIQNADLLLETLDNQLTNKTLPVIECAKKLCICGFCAPKAKLKEDFQSIIGRYIIENPIKTL